MNGVVVRRFHERDIEDIVEIFASLGLIRDAEERELYRKSLEKSALEPRWYDHYLVAELNGEVVGRVILEAAYPPYCELINLYVHSDHRRIGIGSSLVQACIELASKLNCSVMSLMTEPVGNLAAYRLFSKFGFCIGILGDPSLERGHAWLFRFSEESFVSRFIWRHPFAEPSVSLSKISFHEQMLYRMAWREPHSDEALALYLRGQPSQTVEGTMPRIAGFSYREGGVRVEVAVKEQQKIIREGETCRFTVSLWNAGTKPLELTFNTSIPEGTILSPYPKELGTVNIPPEEGEAIRFEFKWLSGHSLPNFTTFPTVPTTCFLNIEGINRPFFVSAGFEREIPP